MRLFYDTEFIEDGRGIDLVSIGVVAEDGREYYAQLLDFDPSKASLWVLDNVLEHLTACQETPHPSLIPNDGSFGWNTSYLAHRFGQRYGVSPSWRCPNPACPWRTREVVKEEVRAFFAASGPDAPQGRQDKIDKIDLWGYYSAYDHVALCQLYGPMIDLPRGWPMYTHDLKQWCDALGNPRLPEQGKGEHHALADARWNRQAWEFLRQVEEDRGQTCGARPAGKHVNRTGKHSGRK